jgi:hypothetical protein
VRRKDPLFGHAEKDKLALGPMLAMGRCLAPTILFADHASPRREALGGVLLHPLGELRRAHQTGLH